MGDTKDKNINHRDILGASGLSGKTITDLHVHRHGSVTVIEIVYSTGSMFIKEKQGLVEVGGTQDFGTGTVV